MMNYPVLMASDILIYKAEVVPVGEDQIQHLELTREIARRFNSMFGEVFPEPQPILTKTARIMALNDPTSKMSKSIEGSYIAMDDDDDTIRKKIRRAVTDVGPQGGEMGPGVKNLFTLLEAFAEPALVERFRADYANQTLRYADLKYELGEAIVRALAPIRERTFDLLAKSRIDGNSRCRRQAGPEACQATMEKVREAMGFKCRWPRACQEREVDGWNCPGHCSKPSRLNCITLRQKLARTTSELSLRYRKDPSDRRTLIRNAADVRAYAAFRMPATFAAAYMVLEAVRTALPQWAPQTLLDVGAGPGTVMWAAAAVGWSFDSITLLEREAAMIDLGRRLAQKGEESIRAARWIKTDLSRDGHVSGHDLVTAAYVLGSLMRIPARLS